MNLETGYCSPRWSGEIMDCAMPMTFDQYGRCSGNCMYCFSFFQKILKVANPLFPNDTTGYQSKLPHCVSVPAVKKLFTGGKSQFADYIRLRMTLQWGGMADPFDMFEKKYGIGLELLQFFKEINYPICFSTKFTWWLNDKRYTDLFRGQKNWNCKFSIIGLDPIIARKIECGIPTPQERLDGIKKYVDLNAGGATLRLRPFIIGWSDKEYEKLIQRAARNGATAVSTEFFCLEGRGNTEVHERYDRISKAIKFDVFEFYRSNSPSASGYMRLNWKVKKPYIDRMEELCAKRGLLFCVSDAHHKDRCGSGCCCGLNSEWNWNRGQLTEILRLAKERVDGLVYWSDMEPHLRELGMDKFLWRMAIGFNTGGTRVRCSRYLQTMMDYIHEIWNTPNNAKSPYKYFGGLLLPLKLDKDHNVVYKYQPYRVS